MQLFRKIEDAPFELLQRGSVATIGVYDGLHLGHQKLLDHLIAEAKSSGLPSVVMSFEPTPQEFFSPQNPPARLMRFGEKFQSLEDYGIDLFYCPHFDEDMRNIEVDTFIRRILVQTLNVRHLVIGDDFRFAKNRSGTMEHLMRASAALDFDVWHIPSVDCDGERVSSNSKGASSILRYAVTTDSTIQRGVSPDLLMQLFRKIEDAPFELLQRGSVATIGVYDGLHLGHQKLLDHLIAEAKSSGLPSVVMSFEPTPQEFFSPQNPPARLMRFGEKFQSLEDYGIDLFYCPHFDEDMRNIEVDTFIRMS